MEFDNGAPAFVYPLNDVHLCLTCSKLLREAVQTSCGHRFCERCIMSKLKNSESNECFCPSAEETCEMLTINKIYPDYSIRKEIERLSVYCTFRENGCEKILEFKDLKKEALSCPFRQVPCPFAEAGCTLFIVDNNLQQHILSCDFRQIKCPLCDAQIPFILLNEHQEKSCPLQEIFCPYQCNAPKAHRRKINDHKTVCKNRPFECKFKSVGCSFTGRKDTMSEHEGANLAEHLELLTLFSAETEFQNHEIKTELQILQENNREMEGCLNRVKKEINQLTETMASMKSSIRDIMLKTVSKTEKLISLEHKLEECVAMETIENQRSAIRSLRESLTLTTGKINNFEQIQSNAVSYAQREEAVALLNRHDNHLGIQDVRLAEFDMRMQLMEKASHDGTMIWKIRDYSKRKQDAITGRTSSLYSQPFYSSRTGYKMCARVYLNGDGIGKGTHMSLFFVVMRGEYDAILSWPFSLRITLMLLDQFPGMRHLSESFSPDPRSSSFQRPMSEMNIASGCPVFVSHATLESEHYIRDDTLFLKISVM